MRAKSASKAANFILVFVLDMNGGRVGVNVEVVLVVMKCCKLLNLMPYWVAILVRMNCKF